MSDARSGNSDPSMDDILASIRKIISDDEARAQVGSADASNSSIPSGSGDNSSEYPNGEDTAVPPRPATVGPSGAKREDVLLLTDLVEEPKNPPASVSTAAAPAWHAEPAKPVEASGESAKREPSEAVDLPKSESEPVSPMNTTPSLSPSSSPLVGSSVAGATSSAFDRLSQAVEQSVPIPAAVDPGPTVGPNQRTIEGMVMEMLRPMLKEWLEKNLPPIVERIVEREIIRLTRR